MATAAFSLARVARAVPATARLAAFYLAYGASLIVFHFLSAYLETLGFRGTTIGLLLAIVPAGSLVVPPLWGRLADLTGRTRTLVQVSAGTLSGLVLLLFCDGLVGVTLGLLVYAAFFPAIGPIVDSVTLAHVSRGEASYARLRLFASVGCAGAATLYGLTTTSVDRGFIYVLAGCTAVFLVVGSSLTGTRAAPPPRRGPAAAAAPPSALLAILVAATFHWTATAAYQTAFPLHVKALGLSPAVMGVATGVATTAEIAGMLVYPWLVSRVAARTLLAAAFVASALRWLGVSWVVAPAGLVALSVLHAASLGIYLVGSVALVAECVGPSRAASGQALFYSATFGLGGIAGSATAGATFEHLGGPALFVGAVVLDVAAAVIVLRRPRPG